MEPWYKVVTPRKEVREGRSFNPDEFAIALEQVVAGTAPEDYRDPAQFFLAHLLDARTARARRPSAPQARGQDRQYRPGPDPDHPVRWRQDAHAHGPVPPRHEWRQGGKLLRSLRSPAQYRSLLGTRGAGRCLCWERLGPAGRSGDPMDRPRPPARRRQGRRSTWRGREDHPAGDGVHCPRLPSGGRPRASLVRRGSQLPQPASRHGGVVPRLHPEPDGGHYGGHPGGGSDQSAAQPGRDDRLGHAVAGQDRQSGSARRQGPHRQRRDRDQRGRAAKALRGPRRRAHQEECDEGLRRLVL